MNAPVRSLFPALGLLALGAVGLVLGPFLSLIRTFDFISSLPEPRQDHLRSGIITSLLWGIPALLLVGAGIVWLCLMSRARRSGSRP